MATTYSGELGVKVYTATVLKHGLLLYDKIGMKPNRMWTPTKMMALAKNITGKKFKARAYTEAASALDEWLEINVPIAQKNGDIK